MTPRAIEKLTNGRTGEIRQRFVIHSAHFVLLQTLSGGRITSLDGSATVCHGQPSG